MKRFKDFIIDIVDYMVIFRKRRIEIRKYKNPIRKKMINSIQLTKEQKLKIDTFYKKNYGKKIPYVWHQNYMAHSGEFNEKQFPELLYTPEFEHFMNMWPEYCYVYEDKNVLPLLADKAKVKMPKIILSVTKGVLRDSNYNVLEENEAVEVLSHASKVFIKPTVESCSGEGCLVAEFINGKDIIGGKTAHDMVCWLKEKKDMVVQERVVCHESISRLYSGSVNTFRILSYRWKNEIICPSAIMRVGRGNAYVDNAHAGGMFVAINGDGVLKGNAVTEFNEQFVEHPDSKILFDGYKIDLFPRCIDAAVKVHEMMPQVGVVNWDFTIDESGNPVLIEVNLFGCGIWIYEMVHGEGAFGNNTEEILKWLRLMRKIRKTRRYEYAFGNMKFEEYKNQMKI